jgi:poly(A) polymerase Pap1
MQLIIVRNAQVPLAKFKFEGIKVDLIFAEMKTPKELLTPLPTEIPN